MMTPRNHVTGRDVSAGSKNSSIRYGPDRDASEKPAAPHNLGLAWDVTRRIRGSEKSRGNPTHGQSDDQAPAGVCSGPIIWSPARRGGVIRCAGRRVAVPSLPAGRKVVSLF